MHENMDIYDDEVEERDYDEEVEERDEEEEEEERDPEEFEEDEEAEPEEPELRDVAFNFGRIPRYASIHEAGHIDPMTHHTLETTMNMMPLDQSAVPTVPADPHSWFSDPLNAPNVRLLQCRRLVDFQALLALTRFLRECGVAPEWGYDWDDTSYPSVICANLLATTSLDLDTSAVEKSYARLRRDPMAAVFSVPSEALYNARARVGIVQGTGIRFLSRILKGFGNYLDHDRKGSVRTYRVVRNEHLGLPATRVVMRHHELVSTLREVGYVAAAKAHIEAFPQW